MQDLGGKQQVQMVKPINVVYRMMEAKQRINVWLQHDNATRIEGTLLGYDEFMNLVLEDAVEINTKSKSTFPVGKMLLKGDNVGLMHAVGSQ
jgi:small nuclear ribonucleoprotein E